MFFILSVGAEGTGGEVVPFLDFIDLGVLAALVVALIRGWLVVGREKDSLEKDKEKLTLDKEKAEEKFELYQQKVQDEILPQLFETTRVLGEVMEMVSQLNSNLERDKYIFERDSRESRP